MEDDIVDVNIKLSNYDDLVNKFNEEELNNELGDYIYEKIIISKINKDKFFRINIETEFEIDKKEKMIDMIRSYYGNKVKEELIFLKHSYIKDLILCIAGILLLVFAYYIETFTQFVLPEIFVILGWLGIGEMGYGVLFADGKSRLKIRLLKKLTRCKIIINGE